MKDLIACCGLDCEKCEARIATIKDDDQLRESTAKKWSVMNNTSEITPQTINCTGCRCEGVKFPYCNGMCEIRKCIEKKGYNTCGDCKDYDFCVLLAPIFANSPECRKNLIM